MRKGQSKFDSHVRLWVNWQRRLWLLHLAGYDVGQIVKAVAEMVRDEGRP